jgi:penicillin-binding protein A
MLLLAVTGAAVLATVVIQVRRATRPSVAPAPSASDEGAPALTHAVPADHDAEPRANDEGAVAGLDLAHVTLGDGTATAAADGGTARLTLDPDLQRSTLALLSARHLPEAAVVLLDVATGKVLVYASHVETGPERDLCTEATAPSASVFKIVTASALVEDGHIGPDTKQCYSGGEQRISALDLVPDPQRDRWCTTLAGAMGRSINTVFARLAKEHLSPAQLEAMARHFGYADPVAFDVPVQPGTLHVPTDSLEFARTAAGFWNTTLSPVQAAAMSATIAREGEAVRPRVVEQVVTDQGVAVWTAPDQPTVHRAIEKDTADQVELMMEQTVSDGTSYRAFHDLKGGAFLPGVQVAGKTGTLTNAENQRYYTWFTGFAPAHVEPGGHQVAVAALVVNGPAWQFKANVVARDVLRAYFASLGAAGVTRPSTHEIARRRKR